MYYMVLMIVLLELFSIIPFAVAYRMQEFFAVGGSLGSSRAVAAFRGVVAVGSSRGVVGVLMPRGLSADGHPSGQARVVQLGEATSEDRAVSSIAFSLQASPQHAFSMYVSAYTPNASAVTDGRAAAVLVSLWQPRKKACIVL